MSNLIAKEYQGFEQIKHIDETGNEYWFARELAPVLEYSEWRNFFKVLDRAMLACKNSGFVISDHFVDLNKMVDIGSATKRKIIDYRLSRYACYLIVQNEVGHEVRQTIKRVGGVLPENQPTPDKSIEKIQKEQLKKLKSQKTLMLDE